MVLLRTNEGGLARQLGKRCAGMASWPGLAPAFVVMLSAALPAFGLHVAGASHEVNEGYCMLHTNTRLPAVRGCST